MKISKDVLGAGDLLSAASITTTKVVLCATMINGRIFYHPLIKLNGEMTMNKCVFGPQNLLSAASNTPRKITLYAKIDSETGLKQLLRVCPENELVIVKIEC